MILRIAITLLIVSSTASSTAEELNILFIGNSFTARHDIAGLVEKILEEGDPETDVNVQRVIYGGQNMFSTPPFISARVSLSKALSRKMRSRIASLK